MEALLKTIYRKAKDFLFMFVNKKFLVFLFFFALSFVFWIIISFNEVMEKEISIPITITNVPKNVVITGESYDTIRVTVRDKGYVLGAYFYSDYIRPIVINFASYPRESGRITISAAEMQKRAYQQLYNSSRIVSIKPEKWDIFYNDGSNKMVPVRFQGYVKASPTNIITLTEIIPSRVRIYAANATLDSIKYVTIEPFHMLDISDTLYRDVEVSKIQGVKIVPSKVKLRICTDVLMEKRLEIPITAENMPPKKTLRTFPSRVSVKFVLGAGMYNKVNESQFKVVADYRDLKGGTAEKGIIRLKNYPGSVSKVKLETNTVDYLIEQQ